jgi:hypothetical protein
MSGDGTHSPVPSWLRGVLADIFLEFVDLVFKLVWVFGIACTTPDRPDHGYTDRQRC